MSLSVGVDGEEMFDVYVLLELVLLILIGPFSSESYCCGFGIGLLIKYIQWRY